MKTEGLEFEREDDGSGKKRTVVRALRERGPKKTLGLKLGCEGRKLGLSTDSWACLPKALSY